MCVCVCVGGGGGGGAKTRKYDIEQSGKESIVYIGHQTYAEIVFFNGIRKFFTNYRSLDGMFFPEYHRQSKTKNIYLTPEATPRERWKKTDGSEAVTALEKTQILNTFLNITFTDERLEDHQDMKVSSLPEKCILSDGRTSFIATLPKSLSENTVTFQWLQACITGIHTNVPKNLFENYRPLPSATAAKDKGYGNHCEYCKLDKTVSQ